MKFLTHPKIDEETVSKQGHPKILIRALTEASDFQACQNLQREIWGDADDGRLPRTFLKIIGKIGGVSAGAFDDRNELIGFVISVPGIVEKQMVHWSIRLGIKAADRNLNLGFLLKQFQRKQCLFLGVSNIYWTFDPMQSSNAHFNLRKLGCDVVDYAENMYPGSKSELHQGAHTDRLVVQWSLDAPKRYPLDPLSDDQLAGLPIISDPSDPFPPLFKLTLPKEAESPIRTLFLAALTGHKICHFYRDTQNSYYVFKAK